MFFIRVVLSCYPRLQYYAVAAPFFVRYDLRIVLLYMCWLVHAIHCGRSPAYLTETVQSVGASRSRSRLLSSSTSSMDYSLPRLHTKFGERAFSHAGPATWNALPDHIRTVAAPVKFRQEAQPVLFCDGTSRYGVPENLTTG